MFLPVDPNLVDGMWNKLIQILSSRAHYIVVSGGKRADQLTSNRLGEEDIFRLVSMLKSRQYVRVGSSTLIPIPAYFSLNLNGNTGHLMELIAGSPDEESMRKDLSLICQLSFFDNKQLEKLVIPLYIVGLEDSELRFEVNVSDCETIIHRI